MDIPKHLTDRLLFDTPMVTPRKARKTEANSVVNETVTLELKGIVYNTPCEDCNKSLDSCRVVHHKKLVTPYVHWSHQCKACNMFKCQLSGEYKLTNTEFRKQHSEVVHQSKVLCAKANPRLGRGRPLGVKNKPKTKQFDK